MIRILGDRVLVALPPSEDETVTASGIVLMKDPDKIRTPTRGIVMQLGEKSRIVDLDDVRSAIHDYLLEHEDRLGSADVLYDELDQLMVSLAPTFDVQVGDCVLFHPWVGEEIHDGEITYVVLRESEIIGIVEPKKEAA